MKKYSDGWILRNFAGEEARDQGKKRRAAGQRAGELPAKVPTDITEDIIREVALPMGFVDIKVCAVDDVWSGLKLVVRLANR